MKKLLLATVAIATLSQPIHARDNGGWATNPESWRKWFPTVMMPDQLPATSSCCGEADAYESDIYETDRNGDIIAVITDGTGGLLKEQIPDGTRIKIPAKKVVIREAGTNPTGHGWVFLAPYTESGTDFRTNPQDRHVFCWVAPTGL
jgi:hypothetical protein